jgi:hypothetical protein
MKPPLVIAIAAAVLGVLVFVLVRDGGVAPAADPSAELQALREEIAAFRAAVETLAARMPAAAAVPYEPASRDAETAERAAPADPGADAALIASVNALRRAVEQQGAETQDALARLAGLRFQSLDQVRQSKGGADVAALNGYIDAYMKDDDAAQKGMRLLSPQEVIARFGPPDRVYEDGTLWTWYLPPGVEDNPDATVEVRFGFGMVTAAYASRHR